MELNKIYCGEALETLKTFESESIDCVVTSPPYWGLRDYGTAEWEGGDVNCNHVRDNKISKSCNTGQINLKELGCGDSIYKDICKKCGAKRIDKQLGLEATFTEYIDKLCNIFDEIKRVLKKTGTCFVNLGDTYGGDMDRSNYRLSGDHPKDCKCSYCTMKRPSVKNNIVKSKSLCQIPSRFAIEMCNRGWILRNELIWWKPNSMPSSARDRFTVDFEKVFFFVKNKKYYFEQQFEKHQSKPVQKNCSKLFSINKTSTKQWSKERAYHIRGRNKRCVWKVSTQPFHDAHFAVYPEKLIIPMIKSGCPENGIVLDPFMGAGTTGLVSVKLNRQFIGIELNSDYIELAEKRINAEIDNQATKLFT